VDAVTARDVLALLERRGARLVAGAAGLEHPVTWASAMRARPPAFESLQGGELALVSLITLRTLQAQDDTLTLNRLIYDLAERGVAAIAVAGLAAPPPGASSSSDTPATRPETDAGGARPSPRAGLLASSDTSQREASAEERALADTLRLPLLALPAGTMLSAVERDIIAYVVAQRTAASESQPEVPRDAYDALLRASLRGDDDRALGQRLAAILAVAVALEDALEVRWCALPSGFPLAREALLALLRRPSSRAELRAASRHTIDARRARSVSLGSGYLRVLAPLDGERAQPDPGACSATFLSVITPVEDASGARRPDEAATRTLAEVIEHVAPLFALALARRQQLESAEQRLHSEALDALLAGTYPDEGRMRARAAQLGHDLASPHVALTVELGGGAQEAATPATHRAAEAVAAALTAEIAGSWARARGGEVDALLPMDDDASAASLAALAERLVALVMHAAGDVAWSAGLGEAARGPVEALRSHNEARDTARLGLMLFGPGHVARTADLGIYRLLLRLRERGELEDFVRRALGPLTAETRTGQHLLETLDAYFACNGNLSLAARRLQLHRNSLIYRLNRARSLLGYDLDDPEARLALQLALKARRVLEL
jgi:purine catabolism regulator